MQKAYHSDEWQNIFAISSITPFADDMLLVHSRFQHSALEYWSSKSDALASNYIELVSHFIIQSDYIKLSK